MEEKGDVLDAEVEAFLPDVDCTAPYDQPQALTTTNMFQANHEDAYDSDVDECPNAVIAFMANLSSTSATNNPIRRCTRKNLLTSMSSDEMIDNHDPVSSVFFLTPKPQNVQLIVKTVIGSTRNCLCERSIWLPANERASQTSNQLVPLSLLLLIKVGPYKSSSGKSSKVIDVFIKFKEKSICSIVLTSDIVVPPSSNCLCEDLRSACDREHTKVLELEAEISKQKQLITESEKRFAFLEQNYVPQSSCDQQALETDRIQLKDTITSLRIQLDGLKVENVVQIVSWYLDLVMLLMFIMTEDSFVNGGLEVGIRHAFMSQIRNLSNYGVVLLNGSRDKQPVTPISLNDMMSASPVLLAYKKPLQTK
ncbi:hypothetical protein Tco_0047654 [Tanacetum coccineum]